MGKQMRILSAAGILGYGFPEDSLWRAMAYKPDFIGCDAGSTDAGPYYLGEGVPFVSREAFKRDIGLLLKAALDAEIPLLVGSCIGGGGNDTVDLAEEIVKEIAAEHAYTFTMAVVRCEQDKTFLKQQLQLGKITSMGYFPELTEQDIDDASHIVGLMGGELFTEALDRGAQVVIAGRTSDTSIFAPIPLAAGFDPGLVWHAAKVLECGAASSLEFVAADCIVVTMEEDCFYVEPANPALHHTPVSVAAHSFYENSSPFHFYEPSGMIDLTETKYEAVSDRKVRVSGSRFVPAKQYTVKLESAKKVGYRTIAVMGTHDPIIISRIREYEAFVRGILTRQVEGLYGGAVQEGRDYHFIMKKYGVDAIMGEREANTQVPFEVGIVVEVVANTPQLSKAICAMARTYTLHANFPGRKCTAGNMGVAFSPSDVYMGAVYQFNMEHLLAADDPLSLVDIQMVRLEGGAVK